MERDAADPSTLSVGQIARVGRNYQYTYYRVEEIIDGSVTWSSALSVEDPDVKAVLYWEPLVISTTLPMGPVTDMPPFELGDINLNYPALYIRGVADDIRSYARDWWFWDSYCEAEGEVILNENDPNFGGIRLIDVKKGGLWYFVHPENYDHVWFTQAGSDWYFFLADPVSDSNPNPRGIDYSDINGAPCWHANRDNWGELHHYDGFYEPYPSGYHQIGNPPGYGAQYACDLNTAERRAVWPLGQNFLGGQGDAPIGQPQERWSLLFCPADLLQKQFRMLLLHPCAACAKELSIPGGQTCWNLNGWGDTTYAWLPDQWAGTGTAMISQLGGDLMLKTSLPTEEPE